MFKAPVRNGSELSAAELISSSPVVPGSRKKKLDAMLLLPAFGLLFCGVAGMLVNGGFLSRMIFDKEGSREWLKGQIIAAKQAGFGSRDTDEKSGTQSNRDERDAEQLERLYRWVLPLSLVASLVVFLGGVSMAFRWNYKLAQVGCLMATVNIAFACCIPGAVAGLWGILMLNSEEGRGHFGR
jgi:hypothetical protein